MLKPIAVLPLFLLALVACSPKGNADADRVAGETPAATMTEAEASSLASQAPAGPSDLVAQWAGKWTGPEGTSLVLTPDGANANVVITNLDGPRTFPGMPAADGIRIVRDGKTLLIHKGSGADTGMKWLADKADCLVVDANEGYCRD